MNTNSSTVLCYFIVSVWGVGAGTMLFCQDPLDPNKYPHVQYSYVLGQRFAFAISAQDLEEMPLWSIAENNPLLVTPQTAFAAAKAWIETLEIETDCFWELESIALVPVGEKLVKDRWCWRVSFFYRQKGISTGRLPMMSPLVDMRGRLVTPMVESIE